MSWAEIKTVNSDIGKPLEKLVKSFTVILPSIPYTKGAVLLANVSAGDKVYSATNVYTENQIITAYNITTIQQDGNLYADIPFVYGWIQKAV